MKFSNVTCVGMHFRGAQAVEAAAALESADNLRLEREPDNAYDAYAIKVNLMDGDDPIHIGYIERSVAAWLSPLLDEGQEVQSLTLSRHEQRGKNLHPIFEIEVG